MSINEQQAVVEGDSLMTLDDVATMTTLCPNSVRNRVRDGRFPAPVTLGRRIAFKRSSVERWVAALPTADFAPRPAA